MPLDKIAQELRRAVILQWAMSTATSEAHEVAIRAEVEEHFSQTDEYTEAREAVGRQTEILTNISMSLDRLTNVFEKFHTMALEAILKEGE
jgi:hypothetical protein